MSWGGGALGAILAANAGGITEDQLRWAKDIVIGALGSEPDGGPGVTGTDEPITTEVGAFACPSPDVLSQALGTPLTPDPTDTEPCRFALDVNGHAFTIVLSYAAEPDLEGCFVPYQPGPLGEFHDLCGTSDAQLVNAWNPWGPGWLYLSVGDSGPPLAGRATSRSALRRSRCFRPRSSCWT